MRWGTNIVFFWDGINAIWKWQRLRKWPSKGDWVKRSKGILNMSQNGETEIVNRIFPKMSIKRLEKLKYLKIILHLQQIQLYLSNYYTTQSNLHVKQPDKNLNMSKEEWHTFIGIHLLMSYHVLPSCTTGLGAQISEYLQFRLQWVNRHSIAFFPTYT